MGNSNNTSSRVRIELVDAPTPSASVGFDNKDERHHHLDDNIDDDRFARADRKTDSKGARLPSQSGRLLAQDASFVARKKAGASAVASPTADYLTSSVSTIFSSPRNAGLSFASFEEEAQATSSRLNRLSSLWAGVSPSESLKHSFAGATAKPPLDRKTSCTFWNGGVVVGDETDDGNTLKVHLSPRSGLTTPTSTVAATPWDGRSEVSGGGEEPPKRHSQYSEDSLTPASCSGGNVHSSRVEDNLHQQSAAAAQEFIEKFAVAWAKAATERGECLHQVRANDNGNSQAIGSDGGHFSPLGSSSWSSPLSSSSLPPEFEVIVRETLVKQQLQQQQKLGRAGGGCLSGDDNKNNNNNNNNHDEDNNGHSEPRQLRSVLSVSLVNSVVITNKDAFDIDRYRRDREVGRKFGSSGNCLSVVKSPPVEVVRQVDTADLKLAAPSSGGRLAWYPGKRTFLLPSGRQVAVRQKFDGFITTDGGGDDDDTDRLSDTEDDDICGEEDFLSSDDFAEDDDEEDDRVLPSTTESDESARLPPPPPLWNPIRQQQHAKTTNTANAIKDKSVAVKPPSSPKRGKFSAIAGWWSRTFTQSTTASDNTPEFEVSEPPVLLPVQTSLQLTQDGEECAIDVRQVGEGMMATSTSIRTETDFDTTAETEACEKDAAFQSPTKVTGSPAVASAEWQTEAPLTEGGIVTDMTTATLAWDSLQTTTEEPEEDWRSPAIVVDGNQAKLFGHVPLIPSPTDKATEAITGGGTSEEVKFPAVSNSLAGTLPVGRSLPLAGSLPVGRSLPVEGSTQGGAIKEVRPSMKATWNGRHGEEDRVSSVIGRTELFLRHIAYETASLAETNFVLLYAIPPRNRMGLANSAWDKCTLCYHTKAIGWREVEMHPLGHDEATYERLFRGVIPDTQLGSSEFDGNNEDLFFFIKGSQEFERDHPSAHWGPREIAMEVPGNYYKLETRHKVNGLRDGEISHGDRLLNLGVTIILLSSSVDDDSAIGDLARPVLHFLDNQDGSWRNRDFVSRNSAVGNLCWDMQSVRVGTAASEECKQYRCSASITMLDYRGIRFVVRDRDGNRWLKGAADRDFIVTSPGVYGVTTTDGRLIDLTSDGQAASSLMISPAVSRISVDFFADGTKMTENGLVANSVLSGGPTEFPKFFSIGTPPSKSVPPIARDVEEVEQEPLPVAALPNDQQ